MTYLTIIFDLQKPMAKWTTDKIKDTITCLAHTIDRMHPELDCLTLPRPSLAPLPLFRPVPSVV